MAFEKLAILKNNLQNLSNLAKAEDQIGFSENQRLSAIIMEIQHESFNTHRRHQIIDAFGQYVSAWLDHLHDMSSIIREFSTKKSDEINAELKDLEGSIKSVRRSLRAFPIRTLSVNSNNVLRDIARIGRLLSKLFNKCKIYYEHIKKQLQDIIDAM